MTKVTGMAGVIALGLMLAAPASAQVGATLVLTSGQKVGGQVIDLNASGVVMTVNGSQQNFGLGNVAVIDFAGGGSNFPSGEVDKAGSGHVLALRSGQVVTGHLDDIGGKSPLRITFNGTDYSSNDVARIYFSRPPGASGGDNGGGGSLKPATGRIRVPANSSWVSTGISVVQGQTVGIQSSGEVRLSNDPSDTATPAGSSKGRYAQGAPLPQALAGALIGRIGNGQPFGIGNQVNFPAPGTGLLYLRVNDDGLGDNSGEFGVDLQVFGNTGGRRRN